MNKGVFQNCENIWTQGQGSVDGALLVIYSENGLMLGNLLLCSLTLKKQTNAYLW